MKKLASNSILELIAVCFFLWSCGDKTSSSDTRLAQAWRYFEKADYSMAEQEFADIVAQEPNNTIALSGLGWSKLRLGDISGAQNEFQLAKDSSVLDGYAGSALISLATDDYADAISDAVFLLQIENSYVFYHDPSINHEDMKLVAAFGYFYTGDYASCKSMVLQLNSSFTNNPTTAQLLQELERLGGLISG